MQIVLVLFSLAEWLILMRAPSEMPCQSRDRGTLQAPPPSILALGQNFAKNSYVPQKGDINFNSFHPFLEKKSMDLQKIKKNLNIYIQILKIRENSKFCNF